MDVSTAAFLLRRVALLNMTGVGVFCSYASASLYATLSDSEFRHAETGNGSSTLEQRIKAPSGGPIAATYDQSQANSS